MPENDDETDQPRDENGTERPAGEDGDEGPAEATKRPTGEDDPYDRRVAPYSGETTVDVDPVEPPDRNDEEAIEPDLPDAAVEEAERLTRLARRVPDDAEAETYRERREELLAEHDYAARVRADEGAVANDETAGDSGDATLVCHPEAWLDEEGAIDPAKIDEIGRAAEVPLGAAGDPDAWDAVAGENDAVVEQVRSEHGDVHAANAAAFARYVSNHHAKPIAAITAEELRWFRAEYYPRNVWPSDEERAALNRSLELVYATLDVPMPGESASEAADASGG